MELLAVFIAKLLSPIGGIIALGIGFNSERFVWVVVASVIGAGVNELVLRDIQLTRSFSLTVFLVGVGAMFVWASVGHFVVRRIFNGSTGGKVT